VEEEDRRRYEDREELVKESGRMWLKWIRQTTKW
jgi:hypothetical protein